MVISRERVDRQPVAERRVWARPTFGPGKAIGVIGAAAVIVSLFLPWREGSVHAAGVPAAFLWDRTTTSSDPSLLVFMIPLAVLLVIGVVVAFGSGVRLLGAVGVLVVTGLFAYQLDRSLFAGSNLGDVIDTGFYCAAIGGILAFVSAFVPARRTVRGEAV